MSLISQVIKLFTFSKYLALFSNVMFSTLAVKRSVVGMRNTLGTAVTRVVVNTAAQAYPCKRRLLLEQNRWETRVLSCCSVRRSWLLKNGWCCSSLDVQYRELHIVRRCPFFKIWLTKRCSRTALIFSHLWQDVNSKIVPRVTPKHKAVRPQSLRFGVIFSEPQHTVSTKYLFNVKDILSNNQKYKLVNILRRHAYEEPDTHWTIVAFESDSIESSQDSINLNSRILSSVVVEMYCFTPLSSLVLRNVL